MKTVLVTGSQGFIGGYICNELLDKGYNVVGVDNFSKYGRVKRAHDTHPNFGLIEMDLKMGWPKVKFDVDYIIAGAAMIGGISYFHKYAYDLLATNERIIANTLDMAIDMHNRGLLKRIVVISSSMVYEGADLYEDNVNDILSSYGADCQGVFDIHNTSLSPWPSIEGEQINILPPPHSTYGFQKLACEYFCNGAAEQYGVPYTIVRPFNCVGLGEEDALGEEEIMSGNVKLMMSHVLPDLVNKTLEGQDPLHILGAGDQIRCYTHGKDVARGIVMAMESDKALNEDFNIAAARQTTVLELAQLVWKEIHGDKTFGYTSDEAFKYDVQKRVPCVDKAKELLGFEAEISLEDSVKEIVDHMSKRRAGKEAVGENS
jgi:UDP-glucose 4-epimerase